MVLVLGVAGASRAADSGPVDLRFDAIPVYQLVRAVFGELLGESYVVEESLVTSAAVSSVDLRAATPAQVRRVIELVLTGQGYRIRRDGEVNVIERPKAGELDQAFFTYRPKFRTVLYLQNSVRSFVTRGRFAGVTTATTGAAPVSATAPQGYAAPGQVAAQSQGNSVTQITPGGGLTVGSADVLLFQGEPRDVELVRGLVAELDVPARELSVRASVFEVQTTLADNSAVRLAASLLSNKIGFAVGAPTTGGTVSVSLGGFEAAVTALTQDSRFRLVSSPSLRVTSGESARVSVGSDVPVLGSVSIARDGTPVQSVNYQPSGVILDLQPVALAGSVLLRLSQQLSSFAQTTTGVNASPTLLKRELKSMVSMRSGELVLLGGLDETSDTDAWSGLRWLPRLFGSTTAAKSRTELLMLVTVEVL